MPLIDDLLLPGVARCEVVDDGSLAEPPLLAGEAEVVAKAVAKRRREFALGRWCAREALGALGVAPVPILPGERNAPTWPDGVVGAITHCAGYVAAVAARADRITAIGIDAEPDEPLPDGVWAEISRPAERERLTREQGRLLFSAKESVYKAWFPLARRWLGFDEAEVDLRADGTFTARILVDGPVGGFEGRWLVRDGLVLTAIASENGGNTEGGAWRTR